MSKRNAWRNTLRLKRQIRNLTLDLSRREASPQPSKLTMKGNVVPVGSNDSLDFAVEGKIVMKRKFKVTGLAPALGREVNLLLKTWDLGIEGAFIEQALIVKTETEEHTSKERIDRQPEAIRAAFVELGWRDVDVKEEI